MFHKLISIYPLSNFRLLGFFPGQEARLYDMGKLIEEHPAFAPLRNDDLFRDVRIDAGGYGISWSDEIDLSSSEIYECGTALDVAAIEKAALLREIVAARQGAGLSQNAVEEASGIRQPVIARMETAATNPRLDTILRALAPLGKTLAVVDVNEEVIAL
ncbi:DUF2442 domain-containing protein [Adlercreutzia muris]|uniref:helix-turn-helix domain-containing protein n=1 Tax=Adlercreutzia muris TaxID=1796610 RepID=UPI0021D5CBFD|nr:helix-turn-helix domain-containing protein [Adlercreutzia muris]MCU7584082.1 DUF2442 domain-containing protein [Adlercreutzia muris]